MHKKFLSILFGCLALVNRPYAQNTVKPFLPEIISQFPNVRDVAISPSGNEVCFTAQSFAGELSAIVFVKRINDKWSAPAIAKFSGQYNDLEPFFSGDGLKLYFASNRPAANKDTKDHDIWYVTRKNAESEWSEPINMGAPINTKEDEFYPSVALNGNLYFTSTGHSSKGKDDIFVSYLLNNIYQEPVSLGDSVNSTGYEFNAFVAPDESFLLYTCYARKDGYGSGDLYISRKQTSGNWSAAQNLGKAINSPQMEYCPFVNTVTGTLYFTSKRTAVDPKFDSQQDIKAFLREANQYSNGQSRLYEVSIRELLK